MSGAAASLIADYRTTGGGGGGFTPVFNDYAPGATLETIPTGATQMKIGAWGGGGGGGNGTPGDFGGGGGSGAYVEKTYTLTSADWGKTLTLSIGVMGAAGSPGTTGGDTTVTNFSFGQTVAFAAHGGGHGSAGEVDGGGGLATGGTTNTNGNTPGARTGGAAIVGLNGGANGKGGDGHIVGTGGGAAGDDGHVTFGYT